MDIHTLDLNFQGYNNVIASYLVQGPAGYLLIETGPGSTLPTLHRQLAAHGLEPADIKHILVTHIHLDHAGAAGWWANQGAQIYVHQVGAPHLADPSRLLQSAGRIYGDQMQALWGNVIPAPREQITPLADGDVVRAVGLQLIALDTPGHAWHHHVFRLEDVAFTGDATGVRVRDGSWITVPAPPPEFKLEVWERTLDRLEAENFSIFYLTHFGRVTDPAAHLRYFRQRLRDTAHFVREQIRAGGSRDEIVRRYEQWNRELAAEAGVPGRVYAQYEAANPLYMSVDGIVRYWRRAEAKETG